MRFSILITCHNQGAFVGHAVESCFAQEFNVNEFEVIVVDDGSTDDSNLVLRRFENRDGYRLLVQENLGQAGGVSSGLAVAKGEFICLLDADDFFAINKLTEIDRWLHEFHKFPEDLFLCHDLILLDDHNRKALADSWFATLGISESRLQHTLASLTQAPHGYPFAIPCGQVFLKETLRTAIRHLDTDSWRRGADNPIAWTSLVTAGAVHYLHHSLGTYRIHGNNGFAALQNGFLVCKIDPRNRNLALLRHLDGHLAAQPLNRERLSMQLAFVETLRSLPRTQRMPLHVPEPAWAAMQVRDRLQLTEREDVVAHFCRLMAPLPDSLSAGKARLVIGHTASNYPSAVAEMEGFCRVLWGLAPFIAGGQPDTSEWLVLWQEGITNGTNPTHLEYWGGVGDFDQRAVEIAALAAALCLIPQQRLLDRFNDAIRYQIATYLDQINLAKLHDNNWHWFRVLANLALARLGRDDSSGKLMDSLVSIESFQAGEGWYRDGASGSCDYYSAFAQNYYALLCAAWIDEEHKERAKLLRCQAASFARSYIHWFDAGGAAIPFGRSLVYRMAQAAFWGALAFAGVEALPWGVIKGLYLRNIRWWSRQKVVDRDGLLTLGYAYPNLNVPEDYSAPASPYWAFKAFLPLALPQSHPFWMATEAPLPILPERVPQLQPSVLIVRDEPYKHIVAFAGSPATPSRLRHGTEKYGKFCYSSRFGFCVPTARSGLAASAPDCALLLSEDGEYFRARERSTRVDLSDTAVCSDWQPWQDVSISTWLVPTGSGWHVRIHRLRSFRALMTSEGGFSLPHCGSVKVTEVAHVPRSMIASADSTLSAIVDLVGPRECRLISVAPNSNVMHPRVVVPCLIGRYNKGTHWLVGAVAASGGIDPGPPPRVEFTSNGFVIYDSLDTLSYRAVL